MTAEELIKALEKVPPNLQKDPVFVSVWENGHWHKHYIKSLQKTFVGIELEYGV